MSTSNNGQSAAGQQPLPGELIANIVIRGDLSGLNEEQKVEYYRQFCDRIGLDPLTQPFKLLTLKGKQILYCDRSGAQQLNRKYDVSHEIVSREAIQDVNVYQVTARGILPDGRHTDSIGAVSIHSLRGEDYANAIMKAETKAKRRATLDLLGLGMLDETEAATLTGAEMSGAPVIMERSEQEEPPLGPEPPLDFSKVYTDSKELHTVMLQATDLKQLGKLYYSNMERIEAEKPMVAEFKRIRELFMQSGQTLPSIKERAYKQLIDRVRSGDTVAAKKASATLSFTDGQKEELNQAFKAYQTLTEAVKQKYENGDQLADLMEACTTEAMIRTLYANNAMVIDRTPALTAKYKNRLSFFAQAPQN